MHRTRVKICGITRPQDALAAAEAGADAIGLVLHATSKRLITLDEAAEILAVVPPFVMRIGLFVDDDPVAIAATARVLGLSAVQLHGNESPDMVEQLAPLPVIKAIPVDGNTLEEQLSRWRFERPKNLVALLMDTAVPGGGGGTGVVNNWDLLAHHVRAGHFNGLPPLIAAGGLTPQNVADVIRKLQPWAVDVSSGVEGRPREKSTELIEQFMLATRLGDTPNVNHLPSKSGPMEQILEHMRNRPAMYLRGFQSHLFVALADFLAGYGCGGNGQLEIHRRAWGFTDWLSKVKGLNGARNTRWEGIIASNYPTEEERFEAFFVLYEEFLRDRPNASGDESRP